MTMTIQPDDLYRIVRINGLYRSAPPHFICFYEQTQTQRPSYGHAHALSARLDTQSCRD